MLEGSRNQVTAVRRFMAGPLIFALVATAALGCGGGDDDDDARPATLPSLAEIGLVAADSPVRQMLPANPIVHPENDLLAQSLLASGELVISVNQFSTTVFFGDAATAAETVPLHCATAWELGFEAITDLPIPTFAVPSIDVDGADSPVGNGCGEDSAQDNLLTVIDLDRGCEWDLWQFRGGPGDRSASYAVGIPLGGSGVLPDGFSARASGFAYLPGAIWPEEIAAGRIEHALFFAYPFTKAGGPVAPATDSDGITDDPTAIPIGARVQLDPALDLDALGLEPYELIIARAMQEYGLLLVDTGGESGIGLYGIDPDSTSINPWEGLLPDDDFVLLSNIPLESLRVLDFGPQDADWASKQIPPNNACTTYQ